MPLICIDKRRTFPYNNAQHTNVEKNETRYEKEILMPQRKNAVKALSAANTKHLINQRREKKVKEAVKSFKKVVESKDIAAAKEAVKAVTKVAAKAASKKVMHKNKASRLASRAQKKVNKLTAAK